MEPPDVGKEARRAMRILIRTDGSATIGSGHVMRMLALARSALREGDAVTFACAELDPPLERRLGGQDIPLVRVEESAGTEDDARWLVRHTEGAGYDWVVIDGYAFDRGYREAIGAADVPVLVVDDHGECGCGEAALILNQNLSASEQLYEPLAGGARLLLGPEFALLQPEFLQRRGEARATPDRARQLLVTMGGADPVNATATVMDALSRYPEPSLRARVVIGASNPRAGALSNATSDSRLELLVGVENMVEQMRWADLAVSAAGTTLLELCFMQVPTILVTLADSQMANVEAAVGLGLCESAGWHADLSATHLAEQIAGLCRASARRRTMSELAGQWVDGLGTTRVLAAMRAWPRAGVRETSRS